MAPSPRPSYTARPGEALRVFLNDRLDFAIGNGRITIASKDMVFVDAVTRDIGRLAHRPEGEAVLRRGDALGHPVEIIKPEPPTEPPNAWTVPDDLAAATAAGISLDRTGDDGARTGTGAGCGSTIVYDPADWPRRGDPRSPSGAEVLLLMLVQANLNAGGGSDPSTLLWGTEAEAER